ncbi:D-hexose-6-phosphate mutarotase [Dermabacteraceae bacterium P13077]
METPLCGALVSLYGAQLLSFTPAGHTDLLWLSPKAVFAEGTAIRGGVPVCAPWFGPGVAGPLSPSHGPCRLSTWELAAAESDGGEESGAGAVTLVFTLETGGFAYRYRLGLSHALTLELSITALDEAVPPLAEAALHTYLRVGDVSQVSVSGLASAPAEDKTGKGLAPRGEDGLLPIPAHTDAVFATGDAARTVHDPVLGRSITLTSQGAGSTIVWNPYQDGPDLSEWQKMLCLESGSVTTSAWPVRKGETKTIRARYEVRAF